MSVECYIVVLDLMQVNPETKPNHFHICLLDHPDEIEARICLIVRHIVTMIPTPLTSCSQLWSVGLTCTCLPNQCSQADSSHSDQQLLLSTTMTLLCLTLTITMRTVHCCPGPSRQ